MANSWIEFRYENDKINGWRWVKRLEGRIKNEPWVTENVTCVWTSAIQTGHSVPKLEVKKSQ